MKTTGRPPRKTADKSKSDSKKPERKSYDKPKTSRSSDSKFKKTDSDTDFQKKSYSDRGRRDDAPVSEKRTYKKRETDSKYSDKPVSRYSDSRKPDDKRFSDKRPYKPRDTENKSSDRPVERYSDSRNRDDNRFSEKRPYKPRESENGGNDRPVRRYDDRNRDDKRFTDKKPYKPREDRKVDKDRPVEKYVDQRRRNDYADDRKSSDQGRNKRPRMVETKTYQGRVHEYKETEILVKDNTYEKRRSFSPKSSGEGIRLNKYIANAGICSRREADVLIEAGAISINGEIVTKLGTKVMPSDQVKYGDQLLAGEQLQYLLLNKPKGYLTTTDDPQERKTVMLIVADACKERIYPVGRLDKNTSGLLLFTNDGELAKKLTHPKHQVEKIYHAELDKALTMADMKKIAEGIELEDGLIKIDAIAYGETKKEVGIELHSGKNRIVRRIFESLGYDVVKLDRVVFAGLTKKELPRGKYRFLSSEEVNILRRIK
ncbi:MAG: pseudouridine synthase [Bacteroidota bacterium]